MKIQKQILLEDPPAWYLKTGETPDAIQKS